MTLRAWRGVAAGVLLATAGGLTTAPAGAVSLTDPFAIDFTLPDRQVPLISITEAIFRDPFFGDVGSYGLRVNNSVNNGSWGAFAFGVTNTQQYQTSTGVEGWNSATLNLANGDGFVNQNGDLVFQLGSNGPRLFYDNLVQIIDDNGFMQFYWTNDAGFILGRPGENIFTTDFNFFPEPVLLSDFVVFVLDQETGVQAAVVGEAQPAPEPASGLLLLGGLAGLAAARRRRN